MAKNNGGPAFPRPLSAVHADDIHHAQSGMSLLDYFAAHAPSRPDWWGKAASESDWLEQFKLEIGWRWRYAEEMVAARARRAP